MSGRNEQLVLISGSSIDFSFDLDLCSQKTYDDYIRRSIEYFFKYGGSFILPDEISFGENGHMSGYAVHNLGDSLLVTEANLSVPLKADETISPQQINKLITLDAVYSPSKKEWPWHRWIDAEGLGEYYRAICSRIGVPVKGIITEQRQRLPVAQKVKVTSNVDLIQDPKDLIIKIMWSHDYHEIQYDSADVHPIELLDKHIEEMTKFHAGIQTVCNLLYFYEVDSGDSYFLHFVLYEKGVVDMCGIVSRGMTNMQKIGEIYQYLGYGDYDTYTTDRIAFDQIVLMLNALRDIRSRLG